MNVKLLKRKNWSDESGVSEIVGNILILMITVVLFTGIMAFVNQIPVPEQSVKADFSAAVAFENLGTQANLTITHVGGAVMAAEDTVIIVQIDDVTYSYKLSEDSDFTYDDWTTGTPWKKLVYGTSYSSVITVMVIDDIRHSAVWVSQVSGGMGSNPPNLLQRYVDGEVNTTTVDPLKRGTAFSFFLRVVDLDNDLDTSEGGVWIDSSDLPANGEVVDLPDYAVGGWYRWDFPYTSNPEDTEDDPGLDGAIIEMHAKDLAGHETVGTYVIRVIELPSDYYQLPPSNNTWGPGGGDHAYGVYAEDPDAPLYPDISHEVYTFMRGERVFVLVGSDLIGDVLGMNDLKIVDARTGVDYTFLAVWELDGSTISDPFVPRALEGSTYNDHYLAEFDTEYLMPGTYNLFISLKESGSSGEDGIAVPVRIFIQDPESPITYFPEIWFFNDDTYTQVWGDSRTTPFCVCQEYTKVYGAFLVQDAVIPPTPYVGEIRISDMEGDSQLYGPPDTGDMISALDVSSNGTCYTFEIDLRFANGDHWLEGVAGYAFTLSHFSDDNEGLYSFSKPIWIRSQTHRADFFIGSYGIYSSKGGSTNFISPEYVYFVENNNFFTTRVIHYQENAPSTAPLYYHNAMSFGDLDNDGDLDLLVASNMDKTGSSYDDLGILLYFENTMNEYGNWQSASFITRPDSTEDKIEWIATGDIDGDGDTDFAYSTGLGTTSTSNNVIVFNNSYGAQGVVFKSYSYESASFPGVQKIAMEDMTGDGCADLIILANGQLEVYDMTQWGAAAIAELPSDVANADILDFDIADVNQDGMLDIITVDAGSPNTDADMDGVWVNNYTENNNPNVIVASGECYKPAGDDSGDLFDTTDEDDDSYTIIENSTGDDIGKVEYYFRMESPLEADTDPQLVVKARLDPSSNEVFYVWYSTDANWETAKYTPVIIVRNPGTTFQYYTYDLPSTVAGATYFWVKITDSSTQLGTSEDSIDIAYLAVESDRFGTFMPVPALSPPTRYQVVSATPAYTCVRAVNFDGLEDGRLEVAVAKNTEWIIYDYTTAVYTVSAATFHADPGLGLSSSIGIADTLFEVYDVNGDGYADILTSWDTHGDATEISVLRLYLSMYPDGYFIVDVKDCFAGMLAGTEKGCVVKILSADIYLRG